MTDGYKAISYDYSIRFKSMICGEFPPKLPILKENNRRTRGKTLNLALPRRSFVPRFVPRTLKDSRRVHVYDFADRCASGRGIGVRVCTFGFRVSV